MRSVSKRLFLLPTLFFVTAAQAAPDDTQVVSKEQTSVPAAATPLPTPAPRQPDLGADAGRGSRYGTGYEARQGFGAGAQGGRGNRGRKH